jgi:hypothetical protein
MGKNQDPGFGLNIPDPQHCLYPMVDDVQRHVLPRVVGNLQPGLGVGAAGGVGPLRPARLYHLRSQAHHPPLI